VHGGDRGLDGVPRRWSPGQSIGQQPDTLADQPGVPARAVLLRQQLQPPAAAGGQSGIGARVDEQQQCQQGADLDVVRHEQVQHSGEAYCAVHQVPADKMRADRRRVAGGEDQMYDFEDGADPLGEVVWRRHAVRDTGGDDLLLGARDPRGHGGLLHQEGAGHLGRRQPAQQPQGQGDLGVAGQGRVTAGEDEPQAAVIDQAVFGPGHRLVRYKQRQSPAQHRFAAQYIPGAVPRDGREPGAWSIWDAGQRPGLQRLCVRVLGALLREIEVPSQVRGGGEHPGPFAAVRLRDRRDDLRTHP
jgi:hypothetical protein